MKWLNNSMNKSKKLKDTYSLHDINIFIKDPLPEIINMDFVLKYIKVRIPTNLLRGVDMIYIGNFDNLKEKNANAMYMDGAVYLTNEQDDDMDMIDDIIHEIAHSNEKQFEQIIYEDGRLEKEFLYRRKQLAYILKDKGFGVPTGFIYNISYDKNIDDYLYQKVTYDVLWQLVPGIIL